MTPALASFEPTGEQVLYAILLGPPLLVALWVTWIVGGWMTAGSLSRYPQLVTTSPTIRTLWRIGAWVPVVGPAAYGVALLVRHAMLGDDGWRAARARPVGQARFVPKRPQWHTAAAQQSINPPAQRQ